MAVVITRSTGATAKGSPLTTAELDQNFINLNLDKVEKEAGKGLSDTNYTQGEKTKLAGLGTAATKNVGTASGNVMAVGAYGLGSFFGLNTYRPLSGDSLDIDKDFEQKTKLTETTSFVRTESLSVHNGKDIPIYSPGLHISGASLWGRFFFAEDGKFIFQSGRWGSVKNTEYVHHTGNILQTTGTSTDFPMSQAATTDQLGTKADTSTQVISGTGLTGGGDLTANRTLSVNYGTAAGTAAQGNDSRLSNSREWTGATISQAEAEAGVATTRRAWTAQSVRQAANSSIAAKSGIANGIASLDANAKIPLSQLSDSIIGQVEYMGLWAASTNTPTLPATPAQKGHYYVVSVSGTQFGHSFVVGDWVISNGASWDKVDNTDAVSTVNGRTGNVTGLAESSDARFTNSREWTATTITQAEAEAGTATTRRAFTAQSVRQAIVAWFNGISGALGRTILTRTTADQVRTDIGLGTASTASVTTTVDDATTGRLIKVGDVGQIGDGRDVRFLDYSDNTTFPVGFSRYYGTGPIGTPSSVGTHVFNSKYTDSYQFRIIGIHSGRAWIQAVSAGTIIPHKEIITTGNILQATGTSTDFPMSQKAVTDKFATLGSAATKNVGTAAGNVMEVGSFGLGAASDIRATEQNSNPTDLVGKGTRFGYVVSNRSGSNRALRMNNGSFATLPSDGVALTAFNRVEFGAGYISYSWATSDTAWSPWVDLLHTGNILQTTGTSTAFPMSQKAVTDKFATLGTSSTKAEEYFALRAGTATQDFTAKEVGTVAANIRATTGSEGVKLEYNHTTKSLDFNFY